MRRAFLITELIALRFIRDSDSDDDTNNSQLNSHLLVLIV